MQVIYPGSAPRMSQERSGAQEGWGWGVGRGEDKWRPLWPGPAEGSFSLILRGALECKLHLRVVKTPGKGAGLPYSLPPSVSTTQGAEYKEI